MSLTYTPLNYSRCPDVKLLTAVETVTTQELMGT